jgi:hypothetical protein
MVLYVQYVQVLTENHDIMQAGHAEGHAHS